MSVYLNWADNTDSDFDHFEIERDGELIAVSLISEYTDETAHAGTTYVYGVRSVDTSGNRSIAATVTVTVAATYAGIYDWVRRRLVKAYRTGQLTDEILEPEVAYFVMDRLDYLKSPYEYADLTGNDKDRFDFAIGHYLAAVLLNPLTTGGANSDQVLFKSGNVTQQLAQIQGGGAKGGERDRWIEAAEQAESRLSWRVPTTISPVGLAARSRSTSCYDPYSY